MNRHIFVSTLTIGLVAGALGGALGLGGGFLIVPALTSLLRAEPRKAVGTSAVVVLAVSVTACWSYVAKGLAPERDALAIAVSALLTAGPGAMLTSRVNPKVLKRCFGGWLLFVSTLIVFRVSGMLHTSLVTARQRESVYELIWLCILGSMTGIVKGLLGVGGGTVLVPALTLLFGFMQKEAQGCALLGTIPPSLVSVATHWRQGNVDKQLTSTVVIGAMVGGVSGSLLATKLPEKALQLIFVSVLSSIGIQYVSL